jgi:hypothetical protein
MAHVTFEADSVYNQRDAEGFIKLNALRLRLRHQGKAYLPRLSAQALSYNCNVILTIRA